MDVPKSYVNDTVSSVGNSWVVCRSKSYSGQIYYFNTLTGKSVWNLSDEEVERAKRRTKNVIKDATQTFPEPLEPPAPPEPHVRNQDLDIEPFDANPTTSRVYNKQVINNRFTEPSFQYPTFITPHVLPSGSINPQTFNNVWAVPPAPFFITSAIPLVNQSQVSGNSATYKPMRPPKIFQTDSLRSSESKDTPKRSPFFQRTAFNTRNNKRFKWTRSSVDLRHKLSARSRNKDDENENESQCLIKNRRDLSSNDSKEPEALNNRSYESLPQERSLKERERCPSPNVESTSYSKDGYCSDADSDWLEDNMKVHGTKLELDVTCLKKLADPAVNSSRWYIVTDTNILMRHLNFLNVIFNSDESCHLMIPEEVMADLRRKSKLSATKPRIASRANRALNLLTQHMNAGSAILGYHSSEGINAGFPYLLDCSLTLADEDYHVVLLTNNEELQKYKSRSDIIVFSIPQLKDFLRKNSTELEPRTPEDITDLPEMRSKDNAGNKRVKFRDVDEPVRGERKKSYPNSASANITEERDVITNELNINQNTNSRKNITHNSKANSSDNTDCNRNKMNDIVDVNHKDSDNKIPLSRSTSSNSASTNASKILLKRLPPVITPVRPANNTNKQQFKWRRRRNNQVNVSDVTSSNVSLNFSTAESHAFSTSPTCQDYSQDTVRPVLVDEVTEGSEANSSLIIPRTSVEKIVEETSTSGIISNTPSNSDCCNDRSTYELGISNEKIRDNGPKQKGLIFEVSDYSMEEYLKMRRDEWISRFVQIMEEVLTEVLQRNKGSLTTDKVMPPPWNIQEATECIQIIFSYHKLIYESAKELWDFLRKISNSRGTIHKDLSPAQFMEMYSYGVSLISTLKSVVHNNHEDLEAASQSLANLLNDIRNPNLEISHNDNFADNTYDTMNELRADDDYNMYDENTQEQIVSQEKRRLSQEKVITTPENSIRSPEKRVTNPVLMRTPKKLPSSSQTLLSTSDKLPIQISVSEKQLNTPKYRNTSESPQDKLSPSKNQLNTPEKLSGTSEKRLGTSDKQTSPDKPINSSGKRLTPSDNLTPSEKRLTPTEKRLTPSEIRLNHSKKVPNTPKKLPSDSDKTTTSSRKRLTRSTKHLISSEERISDTSTSIDTPQKQPEKQQKTWNRRLRGRKIEGTAHTSHSQNTVSEIVSQSNDKDGSSNLSPAKHLSPVRSNNIRTISFCELKSPEVNEVFTVPQDDQSNSIRDSITSQEARKKNNNPCKSLALSDELDYSADIDDELDFPDLDCGRQNEQFNENERTVENVEQYVENAASQNDLIKSIPNKSHWILKHILEEIKVGLMSVKIVCINTCKELNDPQGVCDKREQLLNTSEKTRLCVQNLYSKLNNIIHRETYEPENNLQTQLINAGLQLDFGLNEIAGYRVNVRKLMEQAALLIESLEDIICVLKS